MKITEIWDYLARRKILLAGILVAAFMLGLGGSFAMSKLLKVEQPRNAQSINSSTAQTYKNDLSLVVLGNGDALAYRLDLTDKYRSATVTVLPTLLANEAYIRILDQAGNLVAGEYTEMVEEEAGIKYRFAEEEKTAKYTLEPGYMIEIKAAGAQFYSSLMSEVATDFTPTSEATRYVVFEGGLRRAEWSEQEGEDAIYGMLRSYLTQVIRVYQAGLSEEMLNNKNLDVMNKNRVLLAYHALREADQAEFRDFVEHLERGGSPEISFVGQERYEVGAEIVPANLITIWDNEDGEIDTEKAQIATDLDTTKPGEYTVSYSVRDSDGNMTAIMVVIVIFDPNATEETPEPPTDIPEKFEPIDNIGVVDLVPEQTIDNELSAGRGVGRNDPAESISVAAPQGVMAVGENVEDEEDTSVSEEIEEEKVITPHNDNTEIKQDTIRNEGKKPETGQTKPTGNLIIWIGAGLLIIIVLVKFIFDHYIR